MTGEIARIPVRHENQDPKKLAVDSIVVFCDYRKWNHTITVTAYPAEGPMLEVTGGADLVVQHIPRLNRKTVDAAQKDATQQIDNRTGAAWDLVQSLMARRGLVLNP